MYEAASFTPLSAASARKMLKGHTVRVKHGSGLQLHLSGQQLKKHQASKRKGQGGYNLTLDPYQCDMHGAGFFQDAGRMLKKAVEPIKTEAKKQGRKVASTLIHEGIPIAGEVLGGLAGTVLGARAGMDPEQSEAVGQQMGAYGGRKLSEYVGQRTGLGLKKAAPKKPKKAPRMAPRRGGTLLIDQPFTARQAVDTGGRFFKDPAKTVGFGLHARKLKMSRGGALLQAGTP